uniref:START domain-containing protein n=1 Tax=Globisporangium ultimum (strain ATCC 200006 / CBS 805.95 / DAOM BR144) TaxID=431595 RepID=K3WAI4_GLOUD
MSEAHIEGSARSVSTGTGSGGTGAAVDIAGSTNGKGFRSTHGDALSIEMTFLNPRRRFPLADEFLPRVSVSSAQEKQLKSLCEEMIASALNKTGLFVWDGSSNQMVGGAKPWKQHYSKQNLTLYRRRKEASGDATLRHFVARGQVHSMNLQDVEYGMYCDTTVDERAVMTDLYRDLFLDAAVLKVYETQNEEDPFRFFGIKWLAHVSPADKFVSPRDYAFVEYSKRIVNKMGEPFLVKVVHSLPPDNVTTMNQREFDLIRGILSCTYIYRYDAPTKNVQVFAEGYIDPCGKAPGWLSKSFLTKFAPTIVNLEHSADVKYIMRNNLVLTYDVFQEKIAAQGKRKKKHCATCFKNFGLMARNYSRCRACAETVCNHCLMGLTLCIPNHEKRNAEHP